jgi:general secretion pathway protein K
MTRRLPRDRQRGIALLLVLWAFMILGVLALDFSRYMRDDAMAAVNFADETQGYYVALAGMQKALWQAKVAREQNPATGMRQGSVTDPRSKNRGDDGEEGDEDALQADGQWHADTFHGAKYEVRVTDEGGRIPINRANEGMLTRVITNLVRGGNATKGVNKRAEDEIAGIVDSILDWRDTDSLERTHGAESKWYRSNRGYPAKNGFFDFPQELLQVRGVTADLFYGSEDRPGLKDVITVFNKKTDTINARTVTAPVLQALLGLEAAEAADLVAQREENGADFVQMLQTKVAAIDPTLQEKLVDEPAHTVMIEARADTSQPRNQATVAAVWELEEGNLDEPQPLVWLDRAPWTGALPSGTIPEKPS